MDHQLARANACAGFHALFGRLPTLPEAQLLQAIGMLETSYGNGWKGAGKGSNNMGAIIAGSSWYETNPDGTYRVDSHGNKIRKPTFEYRDSKPDEHGNDHWYTTAFRKYPTPADGWADLAKIVYQSKLRPNVLAAATAGDSYGFSAALYGYYLGHGATVAERIAGHHKAVQRCLVAIATALSEPLPDGSKVPPPTLKRGASGEPVKDLQRLLGLVADGKFGPVTESEVKERQFDLGLTPNGIVDPATWAALLAGGPPKQVPDIPDTEPAPPPAGPSPALSLARIVLTDAKRLVDLLEEA